MKNVISIVLAAAMIVIIPADRTPIESDEQDTAEFSYDPL